MTRSTDTAGTTRTADFRFDAARGAGTAGPTGAFSPTTVAAHRRRTGDSLLGVAGPRTMQPAPTALPCDRERPPDGERPPRWT